MAYTWLGDPGTIMEPLTRVDVEDEFGKLDKVAWAEAWAERLARGVPPVVATPFHKHDSDCAFTDISLPGTGSVAPVPQQSCQYGGIRDLRHNAASPMAGDGGR